MDRAAPPLHYPSRRRDVSTATAPSFGWRTEQPRKQEAQQGFELRPHLAPEPHSWPVLCLHLLVTCPKSRPISLPVISPLQGIGRPCGRAQQAPAHIVYAVWGRCPRSPGQPQVPAPPSSQPSTASRVGTETMNLSTLALMTGEKEKQRYNTGGAVGLPGWDVTQTAQALQASGSLFCESLLDSGLLPCSNQRESQPLLPPIAPTHCALPSASPNKRGPSPAPFYGPGNRRPQRCEQTALHRTASGGGTGI